MCLLAGLQEDLAAVPHIVFRTVHVVLQVSECQLRLNHPELRQMPRCVAVLSPTHWAPSLCCQLLTYMPVKGYTPHQAKLH